MPENKNTLNWRFDVSTFRLIGRELITDRVTALFELVKNCYDANSEKVIVEFYDVASSINSKIIIRDNGIGMSFDDIRDKWMVVGTASKRKNIHSPKPYNRRFVGEKGIGRFAVDKLGGKVLIKTKQKGERKILNVEINWEDYQSLSEKQQISLFTEVGNMYWFEETDDIEFHGTELIITSIRDQWSKDNIERLCKELTKIVSPFHPVNPPFEIYVFSNEFKDFDGKNPVKSDAINFYSHKGELGFYIGEDGEESYQEVLKFNNQTGKIEVKREKIKSFGPISMKIYYFNRAAKKRFTDYYKLKEDDDTRIDGIKIYRDGIVTTPFAETESDRHKQRDVLGIDKRLWQDTFDRIGTREILGTIEITKENNPKIIDSTNRQDFVDTNEYQDFKSFVIRHLDVFSELKIFERNQRRFDVILSLDKAKEDSRNFNRTIKEIEDKIGTRFPEIQPSINQLKKQAKLLETSVSKGAKEQKEELKEIQRKENIYLSLMSLQDYATQIAHAVKTALSSIKDMAEYFKDNFPNPKKELIFKEYASLIHEEMEKLSTIIEFMLSYARVTKEDFHDFSIKELIENLLQKVYQYRFDKENIHIELELQECIVNGHSKFLEDVIQQLISNSIKALEYNTINKKIKCTGYSDNLNYILLFSDNGYGIVDEDKDKIFELYFTTTAEQGGGGIGLYNARTRMNALHGTIELVENEYLPTGTTFKITLPFNKN
ncbi:ATP-binding protein [Emticicia sediminis]